MVARATRLGALMVEALQILPAKYGYFATLSRTRSKSPVAIFAATGSRQGFGNTMLGVNLRIVNDGSHGWLEFDQSGERLGYPSRKGKSNHVK